jgi:hypothetical protein
MKIALTTGYTVSYSELGDFTSENHKEYCERHGYSFYKDGNNDYHYLEVGFRRMEFILNILKTNKYDYIHWSGADTLITNYNIKIEDWVDSEHDFFVSKETSGVYRALNADVFIVKNSPNGRHVLEFILSKASEYMNHTWKEQQVMIDHFHLEPFNKIVKIMPHQSFNSYPWRFYGPDQAGDSDVHKNEPGDFKVGDFLVHVPGHNYQNKIRILKELSNQVIK